VSACESFYRHSFCIQAWFGPDGHSCWGVEVDASAHPDAKDALATTPEVFCLMLERLTRDLVAAGVDLSDVTWNGTGL
jgi:hypothetical protein